MSVIRVNHQKNYVVIMNDTVLQDKTLSWKAKGIWAYCMSRTDNWVFHVTQLISMSEDGEKSVYAGLKELEDAGYLVRIQSREKGKFKKFDYEIHEIKIILPQPEKRHAEKEELVSIDNSISNETDALFPSSPKVEDKKRHCYHSDTCARETVETVPFQKEEKKESPSFRERKEFLISTGIEMREDTLGFLASTTSIEQLKDAFKKYCNLKIKNKKSPIAIYRSLLSGKITGVAGEKAEINKSYALKLVEENGIDYLWFNRDYVINKITGDEISLDINTESFKDGINLLIRMGM